MKIRFALYWLFLFITFSLGEVFFHLCRYGNDSIGWELKFSPVLIVMKFILVTSTGFVFLYKTNVFRNVKEYKTFFLKNIIFISPVALVPMGIYFLSPFSNHRNTINSFSMVIGMVWIILLLFCILYLAYKILKK